MGIKITFEGHHCCFSLINYLINTQVESYLSSLDAIKHIASVICAIRLLRSDRTNIFFVYTILIEFLLKTNNYTIDIIKLSTLLFTQLK